MTTGCQPELPIFSKSSEKFEMSSLDFYQEPRKKMYEEKKPEVKNLGADTPSL
jgi:hypothetical protein